MYFKISFEWLHRFYRLFKTYPTYQLLFNAFRNTPENELKSTKEFLRHATSVAEAVNKAIEVLDDSEKLVPLLIAVGKSHVKRNVTPEHFAVSTEFKM